MIILIKSFLVYLLCFFCLICSCSVQAEGFYTTFGGSFKSYNYKIESNSINLDYFNDFVPSLKYSIGYITKDNLVFSFTGDNMISDNQKTVVNPLLSTNTSATVSRDDYSIFGVYPINKKYQLNVGYRYGVTDVEYKNEGYKEYDEINTYGPYIGLERRFFDNFNLGVYYNFLNTDFSINGIDQDFNFNFKGGGLGFYLGWINNIDSNKNMLISLEYHDYDHDDMINSSVVVEDFSIKESSVSFRGQFIYDF